MRWQDLFADLEGQLRQAQLRERDAEVADRTRRERATVSWTDRAAASIGATLTVATAAGRITGRLDDLGQDWLLLEESGRRSALVPVAAVVGVVGLAVHADDDHGLGRRFGLTVALRAVSRDRAPVVVHDVVGGVASGTIDRVGADHFDLAEHPPDLPRRPESVTGERVVPFAGLAVVRRA
ncbi:hypothetical protein PZ938_19115 [Luteipulveratus sp. YIM 133132]|uniref:Uncharacterized protein n=1 Tax=Luteipulveratus flavus TaxID=3031728 RepID=A0ABT6C2C0_9MICO|nr:MULTISPECIES: hypothetical protein [unclassified Luteipulveratus]MDE9367733.1 hypothetical protein [Luteipulveratus sp. YIM 133132]MDF8262898.1 hypothetical protein [Luteipulveratus sp. YIM 133296]